MRPELKQRRGDGSEAERAQRGEGARGAPIARRGRVPRGTAAVASGPACKDVLCINLRAPERAPLPPLGGDGVPPSARLLHVGEPADAACELQQAQLDAAEEMEAEAGPAT